MKSLKKLICVLIALTILTAAVPLTVHAYTQKFGDIVCTLDESTGVVTISGKGDMENFYDPSEYWYGITGVGFTASAVKSIIVNEGVTSIGSFSFYNCTNLTSVKLPESVTKISSGAFKKCSHLETINIPENVTFIGSEAFAECKSLKSIPLPDSLTGLGKGAFYGCSGITSISFPDSLTSIPEEVCRVCFGLKEVKLPENITEIPRYAFRGCKSLVSINIPASVTSVGEEAFASCFELKDLDLSSVQELGSYALKGTAWEEDFKAGTTNGPIILNDSILYAYAGDTPEELTIRSGIKAIMSGAFKEKQTLKRVTIESETIGREAFRNCKSLEKMTLTDNVKKLGISAFEGCTALKDTKFSKNLSFIEEAAFSGDTSLVEVVLPDGVNKIGLGAFNNCENLESLEIYSKYCNAVASIASIYSDESEMSSDYLSYLRKHGTYPFSGCNKLIIYSYPSFLSSSDMFMYGFFPEDRFKSFCVKYDNFEHVKERIEAENSTCTTPGHSEYYRCKYCLKPLSEYTTYPLIPHKLYEYKKGKKATCTEDGYTPTRKCSICNQIIEESTVIPSTGHSFAVVPGVSATETETGLTEGVKCTVCGEWKQIQKVIPRIGDVFGDLTGDKKINGLDAGLLNRYVSGWVTGIEKIVNIDYADVNQDGKINGGDAAVLARYVSGWQGYESYFEN